MYRYRGLHGSKEHHWFYLAEGMIDVIFAFILVAGSGVMSHFDK